MAAFLACCSFGSIVQTKYETKYQTKHETTQNILGASCLSLCGVSFLPSIGEHHETKYKTKYETKYNRIQPVACDTSYETSYLTPYKTLTTPGMSRKIG